MKKVLKAALSVLVIAALLCASAFKLGARASGAARAGREHAVWDGTPCTSFAGGSGSQSDPYLISNGAELAYLAQQVMLASSFAGAFFELTDDIYLNDTSAWENWSPIYEEWNECPNIWITIGNKVMNKPFSGNFNGNGHTIYGLYTMQTGGAMGLFGYALNANISNLHIAQSRVFGFNFCAGIIGYAENCTITDCVNGACVKTTQEDHHYSTFGSGGIVGYAQDSAIERCVNTGLNESFGTTGVGGIVGKLINCTVSNCENNGIFNGYGCSNVGGIIGDMLYGEIAGCTNCGTESEGSVSTLAGGIAGSVIDGRIKSCVNLADFATQTSGIVGRCGGIVIDCENYGNISGGSAAGIAGDMNYFGEVEPIIENCINRGEISGRGSVAGIASSSSGIILNCKNYGPIVCEPRPSSVTYGGGICAESLGSVVNCVNFGNVQGINLVNVGGICGRSSIIESCENRGNVSVSIDRYGTAAGITSKGGAETRLCVNYGSVSGYQAGGVVGMNEINSLVSGCANHGSVTGSTAGGIAYENIAYMEKSYNTGSVSGQLAGGIVCYNTFPQAAVEDCYNIGGISAVESAAGIAASASGEALIRRCYNIGDITSETDSGAIFGRSDSELNNVSNCCYLEGCCESEGQVGEALSAQALTEQESYSGFDFDGVWTILGDPDYLFAELIAIPHASNGEVPPPDSLPGDVDGNGAVSISDAIIVLRLAMELEDGSGLHAENADVNGSGDVSVADAILAIRIALELAG